MDLAPWTAPAGHSVESYSKLSLERARALPSASPRGRVSRDLLYVDGNGTWHPEEGVTPDRIRCAFREAERGYPEMQVRLNRGLVEGDAHARSLFEKRNAAVASKPTVFQPGDPTTSGQQGARVFEIAMRRFDLPRVLGHLLTSTAHGYSGVEIEWGTMPVDGRLWVVPIDLILVPTERFRIGAAGMTNPDGTPARIDELRVLADIKRPQGDELEHGKWIVLRYGTEVLARAGQCRTAAAYLMGKRYAFRDWIILSERFGIPLPVATYDEEVEEWAKEVATMIVQKFGSDGGAVIPKGVELEVVKGVEVNKALQGPLIEFSNRELSKLVNGSTDATDASEGGSYARAAVHGEVRFESVRADASALHAAIDTMLSTPFAVWNGVSSPPLMRQQIARDFSPQALVTLAGSLKNELGVDVSKQQLYEETGLRPPINDADKAPGAPQPEPKSQPTRPAKEDA